jgi:hypothetical protein
MPIKRLKSRRVKRKKGITRKQKGGNTSPGESESKRIVFYTCFFGPSGSASDVIPMKPSDTSDCYYFTNNPDASKTAAAAGWNVVDVPVDIKTSERDNAMDSKEVKACPHHFKELQGYTYSCYFDSKLKIKENDINDMLKGMEGDVVMLVNKHPFITNSVQKELNVAMDQPRYAQNKGRYVNLINSKMKNSRYKNKTNVHYETSCILRKCGSIVDQIGEEWFEDIKKTGPECQISFFFVQQKYKDNIKPLPVYYGRS